MIQFLSQPWARSKVIKVPRLYSTPKSFPPSLAITAASTLYIDVAPCQTAWLIVLLCLCISGYRFVPCLHSEAIECKGIRLKNGYYFSFLHQRCWSCRSKCDLLADNYSPGHPKSLLPTLYNSRIVDVRLSEFTVRVGETWCLTYFT